MSSHRKGTKMDFAINLLKASHIGVRELKGNLTAKLLREPLVITDRGIPVSVSLPYSDILELLDIIDEISDAQTVETVREGREAIAAGNPGIPVENLFKKLRDRRK